jgi:hypothetical protein
MAFRSVKTRPVKDHPINIGTQFAYNLHVNLSIRPWKNIHTALSYGPVRLFNKSVTNWLFLYWPWNRFPTGLGANTAYLESISGPIQKQPISNTIIYNVMQDYLQASIRRGYNFSVSGDLCLWNLYSWFPLQYSLNIYLQTTLMDAKRWQYLTRQSFISI